jgi:hypothetical protein
MSRRYLTGSLLVVGAWTLVGLLDVAKAFMLASIRGERPPLAYLVAGHLPYWYGWAILTPLVAFLVARFPLGREWRRSVPIHAAASVILGSLHLLASAVFLHTIASRYRPAWFTPGTTAGRMIGQFFDTLTVVEILVYWAIVGVVAAWTYYDRSRQKEILAERLRTEAARLQLTAADARLRALRHELEPHFLFNTLNSVAGMVRTGRGHDSLEVLVLLSELLRETMGEQRSHEISVRDEVALLRKYLEIQRIRFADRLSVEIEVDPAVEKALVPSFILQPLVENAVRHGLERHTERGCIEVTARRLDGRTELVVRDQGAPRLDRENPVSVRGIGLTNTRERLHRLYGKAGTFELSRGEHGETTARICLPFHTSALAPAAQLD